MKFQKYLGFFDVLGSNAKKALVFFGIFQNSKKNPEFSKIPKIFGQVDKFLEFWKTRGFLEFWFHKVEKHFSFAKNLQK